MKEFQPSRTSKINLGNLFADRGGQEASSTQSGSIDDEIARIDDLLSDVDALTKPVATDLQDAKIGEDLRAILEASIVINSSLSLDDVLRQVMHRAVELLRAERGLIMLLDENGELHLRSAYNIDKEAGEQEDFKISKSIASQVAVSGVAVYTSDAQSDAQYQYLPSVRALNLRSIMCVPIKVKETTIGVIYLDNSTEKGMFLKSDLYVFGLYAQMVANALHNARVYEALYRIQHYSASVIEKMPIGIVVLDKRGRVATINPAALEIFDFNRERLAVIGQTERPSIFTDLLPESERTRWKYMMNTALSSQEEYSDARYFHNTGYVEKALSIKISPITQLPDGSDGLILAVEDTSEKVVMEKYVILSEKLVAKGEMAASIAHELNNYLAIASTNAELLSLNLEAGKQEKAIFNSKAIVENIFKIKRFVDNLMDFSRQETEFIPYDVRRLIEDLLFSLRPQTRFKRMQFSLDMSRELPSVEMDVGQIQQVLMNLLNNAADATEERALAATAKGMDFTREISISVNTDSAADRIRIDVSDNGIGMNEETLKKIFMIHFTTKKSGHGLGLANCRKIIQHHTGELLVSSTYGQGTTFTIYLPRFQPKTSDTQA